MTTDFPPLYKKGSAGGLQVWNIEVVPETPTSGAEWAPKPEERPATIITRWGRLSGKQQRTEEAVKQGKNLGKANATTPMEQACAEAQSRWEKQLKKGYVRTPELAEAETVDTDTIKGGVFPMLALKFKEDGHKVQWPAYAQPKLDGHRCLAVWNGETVTLWSRTRKPITSMPHIVQALQKRLDLLGIVPLVFDGELYNHDYRDRFQELTKLIRPRAPVPGHEVMQYHVYDIASRTLPFKVRSEGISNTFDRYDPIIHVVETIPVEDETELIQAFARFRGQGYEGAMVRNANSLYQQGRRSPDLQKLKEFEDDEFTIVGVDEGKGKDAGHAVFTCALTADGPEVDENRFTVKLKGPTERLRHYFEHPPLGQQLTVSHQGWYKSGKPRCPVGLRLREDI